MGDLMKELCVEKCLVGRLVKSRMKWAGPMGKVDEVGGACGESG